MKRVYLLHPSEYALGATEKVYTDKAAAGLELVSRGKWFDCFEKTEPKQMKYRIEVAVPRAFEDAGMPEEQIAVYEDCGWEYVSGQRYIHVFRAPADSDTEDFYLEPEQQAKTIKALKNQYIGSFFYPFLWVAFYLSLGVSTGTVSSEFGAALFGVLMTHPAMMAGCGILMVWGLYDSFVGMWHITRLYRRMKKGIPLDHAPKGNRTFHRWFRMLAALMALCCGALWVAQLCSYKSYEMPMADDAPYLMLSDFGLTGERAESYIGRDANTVSYKKSLLLEYWDTFEAVKTADATEWFFQDTFRLKNADHAYRFAQSVMADSAHARSMDDFVAHEIEGLDYAWTVGNYEYVAIKGNLVTTGTTSLGFEDKVTVLLQTVAECWKAIE